MTELYDEGGFVGSLQPATIPQTHVYTPARIRAFAAGLELIRRWEQRDTPQRTEPRS